MTRRKRKLSLGEHVQAAAIPVSVEELGLGIGIWSAATSGKMPVREDGGEGFWVTPSLNRGALALMDNFNAETSESLMWRIRAMIHLRHDYPEEFGRRAKPGPEPGWEGFDDVIVEVAATLPLDRKGKFDGPLFWKLVEERGK